MKSFMALIMMAAFLSGSAQAANPQTQPEVIKKVNPNYPRISLLAGIEGTVYVRATVDESGKVVDASTVDTTHHGFGQAAIDAIKQWEFKPATLDGKPIKAEVTIPVKFRIGDADLPPGELVTVRQHITKFIEQGSTKDLLPAVDTSANVILGADHGLLLVLFNNKSWVKRFSGGATEILDSHLRTDAMSDAAIMDVHTRNGKADHYHTIVLMKDKGGSWKIVSWHVSP